MTNAKEEGGKKLEQTNHIKSSQGKAAIFVVIILAIAACFIPFEVIYEEYVRHYDTAEAIKVEENLYNIDEAYDQFGNKNVASTRTMPSIALCGIVSQSGNYNEDACDIIVVRSESLRDDIKYLSEENDYYTAEIDFVAQEGVDKLEIYTAKTKECRLFGLLCLNNEYGNPEGRSTKHELSVSTDIKVKDYEHVCSDIDTPSDMRKCYQDIKRDLEHANEFCYKWLDRENYEAMWALDCNDKAMDNAEKAKSFTITNLVQFIEQQGVKSKQ